MNLSYHILQWISIFVSIYCIAATVIESCNNTRTLSDLPQNWPCEWSNDKVPYAYNFFLPSPNRLVNVAERGIRYIEAQSCLKFVEHNPVLLARGENITYLFFTFSDVLEYCCVPLSSAYRRRVVLLTPLCTLPEEVAHAILHAMGLTHKRHKPFPTFKVLEVLKCKNGSLRT